MSHVIHRNLHQTPPTAMLANGLYITDSEGRRFIDACGGAAVSCLGHSHPEVLAAMRHQLDRIQYTHTSFFTTEVCEELAELLARKAPAELGNAFFVSGGSEAVESAMKLARQHFVESGQPHRDTFIARRQSYHGNTLGALALGGNEWRRKQYAPLLMEVPRVSPCYEYRDRNGGEDQQAYTRRLLDELEGTIQATGPQRIIAFCAEPVAGATLGAAPPTPGYFRGVREICDRHGILLLADEVMCGMGRTGTCFALEQEGVVPDLVTVAKGLGGGYAAIGAVLASDRVLAPLRGGSGIFQHGHTYIGHPVAAAAALAVQRIIERDGLLNNVIERGAQLMQVLEHRLGQHPNVGDIRGRGLFVGVELVQDRASKEPFDPARNMHARVKEHAKANGLLVYPSGGTIDGRRGDHVLLAPPFISTSADIDQIVQLLGRSIDQATGYRDTSH